MLTTGVKVNVVLILCISLCSGLIQSTLIFANDIIMYELGVKKA